MLTPAGRGIAPLWEMAQRRETYLEGGLGRLKDVPPSDNLALSIALQSARDAFEQAGWNGLGEEDGLVLATTTGRAPMWDQAMLDFITGDIRTDEFEPHFQNLSLGRYLDELANHFEFKGRRQLVTTACAAGVHALAIASLWIRSGRVKRCLVGGTEVLCRLTLDGFGSLQLLSPNRCRPFDVTRSGINLAEGGAFLCLESEPKNPALAEIDFSALEAGRS